MEPVSWEEVWRRLMGSREEKGPRRPARLGRVYLLGLVLVVAIWLLSGTYVVGPGEQGVVRRFGREVGKTSAGLNYHLPWPVETVDVVDMAGIRKVNIGFREVAPGRFEEDLSEALMLAGDANIVSVHLIVQYRVKDASQYLFKVRNPDTALKAAAEVALRHTVGQHPIDYTLVEARAAVEEEVRAFLQGLLDDYETGLLVTQVKLQEVDAPQEVRDAFQDVVRAKEDKQRLIREAQGYAADVVPKARGQKQQVIKEAEAYKERRVIRAQGEAERFLSVLAEYKQAPEVTRKRLYLETLENILPNVEKIIIDSKATGGVLPMLPLQEMAGLEKPGAKQGQ
jgi:membrane protease subunit HflK